MSNKTFKRVSNLRPGRSVFDLSYEKKLTCDMGQIIPVMHDEMVPGDTFIIGNQLVIRAQPLVAPILHEINAYVHYFFVPYRLLWEDWEEFITGGVDGDVELSLPRWVFTSGDTNVGGLWDYMGMPTGVAIPANQRPLQFPQNAYNLIYNEYYRDETLIDEISLTSSVIQNRCWEKDYFTSALPWQQRGTAPALPITGTSIATWLASDLTDVSTMSGPTGLSVENQNAVTPKIAVASTVDPNRANAKTNLLNFLNSNEVDLSSATTFNVSDLRLAFQVQKFLERNARSGARYIEFLGAHFGVHPRDERLQRPEYVGGSKSRIIVSEVLQTSSTDATTPQGNMAGHGISADQTYVGKYTATEFGIMMGLLSIMPKPAYMQGVDRQWLKQTKYDFYFPEFVNLSEQAILREEIYASAVEAENNVIFGYQGRYDEMRYKPNLVCGLMRTDFDYWHLARKFSSAPALNETFITCNPASTKRIFASPTEPGLIVSFGNIIKAIRPMTVQSNPGLIDHD